MVFPEQEEVGMKKKWLKLRAVITMCAALGWWGLLYPELTLTPDTLIIYEVDAHGNRTALTENWKSGRELYRELLSADRDAISFRSKFLEDLSLFWEALQNGIE